MLWSEDSNSIYDRALKTQRDYASYSRYPIYILDRQIVQSCDERSRECNNFNAHNLGETWQKLIYLQSILVMELGKNESQRLEWLVWQDADTISLSLMTDLAIFLPPSSLPLSISSRIHLPLSYDSNGPQ